MSEPDISDRVARDLRVAAAEIPLRRGSEHATIRAAHRRRNRNRRVIATTTVVIVGGGTTVAIQQLGKTSPDRFATGDDRSSSTDNVQPGPVSSDATVPEAADNNQPPTDFAPAERVASNYQWSTLTPDAAKAVFGIADGTVPGIILSTAPGVAGTAPNPQQAYWSDDGISFEPIPLDPPTGILRSLYASGDRIYTIGTAAGVAATDPNPILVAASADRGQTWSTITLPVDTNDDGTDPWLAVTYTVQTTGINGSDDAVVIVFRETSFDGRELPEPLRSHNVGWNNQGVLQNPDDCETTGTTTTIVSRAPGTVPVPASTVALDPGPTVTPTASTTPALAGPDATTATQPNGCQPVIVPWAQIGLPADTIAHLDTRTTRVFRVVDGQATEIALPAGATRLSPTSSKGVLIDEQSRDRYELTADGAWVELPAYPFADIAGNEYSTANTTFVQIYSQPTPGQPRTAVIASSTDTSNWTYADSAPLYGQFDILDRTRGTSTDDTLATIVRTQRDAVAEQGGTEITDGDVVARLATTSDPIVYLDAATRELIDPSHIQNTDNGIIITDADGNVRAEFPWNATEQLYPTDNANQPAWYIETTSDGAHVASESIANLLNIDPTQINSIGRVTANGRQLIIAVTLTTANADGTPQQTLLVGTPLT